MNTGVSATDYDWTPAPTPVAAEPVRKPARERGTEPKRVFDAELDVAEMDDRGRPGAPWTARSRSLNCARLVIISRRMCYLDKTLVVAVHLIDDKPVGLAGKVIACDYDADGLYALTIELVELPRSQPVQAWLAARSR